MLDKILKEASQALSCDWENEREYNVTDSIWFNDIGIVEVETEHEVKYYIGRGKGVSQHADEQHIAAWGSKFDFNAVKNFFK